MSALSICNCHAWVDVVSVELLRSSECRTVKELGVALVLIWGNLTALD